jgi:3-methyladenine DNA glycosylase/8-oxoguanine DNA glycosylase
VPAATLAFGPVDLRRSMVMHRLGMGDPTAVLEDGRFEKAWRAAEGVVRVVLHDAGAPGEVTVEAAGPGAEEVLAAWLPHLPPADGHDTFETDHPVVRRLHRASRGLRILRVPWLFDVACSSILQQRVTLGEARQSWARIARVHGERADAGHAFPPAARLEEVPGWELERLGVDPKRGRALRVLAREEARRPFLALGLEHGALRERLARLDGIGPWTTEMVLGFGAGDPDAVLVGDLHAPSEISWALAGEPRGDDARMLELLEPFRGHRFRVTRLVLGAGRALERRPPGSLQVRSRRGE